MSQIIMYYTTWCPDCVRSKALFDQYQIQYQGINIDEDQQAAKKVVELNQGMQSVPTILFPDQSILTEPSDTELESKLKQLQLI